tara:strand:+ start:8580 stop:9146 length:567 start_codon:yes stop_codon:yes gene_type:complete
MLDPIIILIGGAAGTSKTSNGQRICESYNIAHRIGTGFIREYTKHFISKSDNKFLYNFSFTPPENISPFDNLFKQSQPLKSGIDLCIKRARNEGTSLIVEGVNIIPGMYNYESSSIQIIFYVNDFDQHYNMIQGKTHSKRIISRDNFLKVRDIQNKLLEEAKIFNWVTFDLSSDINIITEIGKLIKKG